MLLGLVLRVRLGGAVPYGGLGGLGTGMAGAGVTVAQSVSVSP